MLLAATAVVQPAAAQPRPDGLNRALARGEIDRAQHALYRALALFEPARVEARFGRVAEPGRRDATLLLLDLARRADQLAGSERTLAQRLLARPTGRDPVVRYSSRARYRCNTLVCVFWVTRTRHAPPLRDRRPRNGIPDQVDLTLATFRQVYRAEVGQLGFQRPLSDRGIRNHGPNGKPDIYLADVGARGMYGYCAAERRARRTPAHCVVDDDFSARQFSGGTAGKPALQVTAAHEFLHAIQFGYDAFDDFWFFESTATWVEDEIYPTINDNVQYLPASPIGAQWYFLSLDTDDTSGAPAFWKYGAWIYWRYMSERFGRDIVREAWTRARDGAVFGLHAAEQSLAARGLGFADFFHTFGVNNYFFPANYAEGALYASVPGVGPQAQQVDGNFASFSVPMPHSSNDYYLLTGLSAAPSVDVTVTFPADTGSRASVVVTRPTGNTVLPLTSGVTQVVPLDATVTSVLLVFSNGSTRFTACGSDAAPPFFTCFGAALDDGVTFSVNTNTL